VNVSVAHDRTLTDWFSTDYLKVDLKKKSVRGGAVTASTQAVKFILRTGSTMVVARLLTPADFGLIAMVTALTGFAMMFRDLGLSMATIQSGNITHGQVSNLFWVNVAVGGMIAVAVASAAPAVAWFYGNPDLTSVTRVLSIAFVFSGLGVQHKALLRRQMRFTALGLTEIGGMAAGVTATIVAALFGAGYWSLVILTIITEAVTTLGAWIACSWRPGRATRRMDTRRLLRFGGNVTGFGIVNYFARNLDNILIGRYWGAQVLGLYNKAYYIMMLPVEQIRGPLQSVAMPALSHMQEEPERYRRYYLNLISILAFITMPIMALLYVSSVDVILLVLGPGWTGSVSIFQILCFTAFIQPVASTRGLILVSSGQSGRYLRWGIVNSILTAVSFVTGIRWGAAGVALSYTAANYIILVPSLWYCYQFSPIKVGGFFSAIARPAIISVLMAIELRVLRSFLEGRASLIVFGILLISGGCLYFGLWLLAPGGWSMLKEIGSYWSLLTGRDKAFRR
jgi:O-antigen/teichoic acid export membrane protein